MLDSEKMLIESSYNPFKITIPSGLQFPLGMCSIETTDSLLSLASSTGKVVYAFNCSECCRKLEAKQYYLTFMFSAFGQQPKLSLFKPFPTGSVRDLGQTISVNLS